MPSGLNFPNLFLCNLSKKFQVKRKWSISKVRRRLNRVLLSTPALTQYVKGFQAQEKGEKRIIIIMACLFPQVELVCLKTTFVNLAEWRENTIVEIRIVGLKKERKFGSWKCIGFYLVPKWVKHFVCSLLESKCDKLSLSTNK